MSNERDMVLEVFADFLNGVEAAVSSAKALLKKVKVDGSDPSKISWIQAQGAKGPYEKATQQGGTDYRLLVQDLLKHGRRMRKDGYFTWLFEDNTTIGRKKEQQKKKAPTQKTINAQPVEAPNSGTIDVETAFPADLHALLNFQVEDDFVTIRPRQYLGSDIFRRIAAIVRDQLAGEYVSAGRESHFRVPKMR